MTVTAMWPRKNRDGSDENWRHRVETVRKRRDCFSQALYPELFRRLPYGENRLRAHRAKIARAALMIEKELAIVSQFSVSLFIFVLITT